MAAAQPELTVTKHAYLRRSQSCEMPTSSAGDMHSSRRPMSEGDSKSAGHSREQITPTCARVAAPKEERRSIAQVSAQSIAIGSRWLRPHRHAAMVTPVMLWQ